MPLVGKVQSIRWRHAVVAGVLLAIALLLGTIGLASGGGDEETAPAEAAPTRVASPIDPGSTRPPDDPSLAPDEDPAADSSVGIEAQKLLDELRSHDVPFTDADANVLVDIGDKNVARGQPDLEADDPVVSEQVAAAFPQFSPQQRADSVRCLAEYVEQTIAKNRGTVPPDGQDHN